MNLPGKIFQTQLQVIKLDRYVGKFLFFFKHYCSEVYLILTVTFLAMW